LNTASDPDPSILPGGGPSLAAAALWDSSGGRRVHLLTDEERARLAAISTVVRFRRGEKLYAEGDRADFVFNIISGVVKSYKVLPDTGEYIVGFLFPDDVIGLAEEGHYVNSAEAVTPVTGYRMPASVLQTRLPRDPSLEFHIICKLCHELREAQRHAFLLRTHRALPKIARFLLMLDGNQVARGETTEEVYLPMTRSDIGDYICMSAEAVSRSFRNLASQGVISIRNRRYVKIINRAQLERVSSESPTPDLPP
jgi:CRP/FNR family transcriptional regulator, anaerobic regulatory protein